VLKRDMARPSGEARASACAPAPLPVCRNCGEKGLPPMVPLGKVFRGDALARRGEFADGKAQMREGIAELRSIGALFSVPSFFAALASAYLRSGNVADA
jgi:hypothetical protein